MAAAPGPGPEGGRGCEAGRRAAGAGVARGLRASAPSSAPPSHTGPSRERRVRVRDASACARPAGAPRPVLGIRAAVAAAAGAAGASRAGRASQRQDLWASPPRRLAPPLARPRQPARKPCNLPPPVCQERKKSAPNTPVPAPAEACQEGMRGQHSLLAIARRRSRFVTRAGLIDTSSRRFYVQSEHTGRAASQTPSLPSAPGASADWLLPLPAVAAVAK
ncbi:homeobox protein MSX-2-like [Sarcophilus harrisii]|uniref:homeobox protein MSX-2-like n=1 Tax=Sarcophilus harrisii TaxID=9305 RepID=UPI001301FE78|nr:homeobox protein MSX-2-like [Sarcophilus harrisii]